MLQGSKQRKEHVDIDQPEGSVLHRQPTFVIPVNAKKSKYKTHVGMITEKSWQAVNSVFVETPIIAVELTTAEIELLGHHWLKDEDTFKKSHSSNREYALQVKRQLVKCIKTSALVWLYSALDFKVTPLVLIDKK